MTAFFYNLSITIYGAIIWLIKPFNSKADEWYKGRNNWKQNLQLKCKKDTAYIWFHASSLGEFEQARPVIEEIRSRYPLENMILSFFSPSGYKAKRNYNKVDCVVYLPLDTPANAKYFIEITQPKLALFAKYDFWFNYITELQHKNIPTIFFSSVFRKNQFFFKWPSDYFIDVLKKINAILLQDTNSGILLDEYAFSNYSICGDTRIDRVIGLIENQSQALLKKADNKKLLVLGSSYAEEEKIALSFIKNNPDWQCIIAPHDVGAKRINQLIGVVEDFSLTYHFFAEEMQLEDEQVIIINSIGVLNRVYQYADVIFVGGGFGKSIHNVLEAAVYKKPVIVGPNHYKFWEVEALIDAGVAFEINDFSAFVNVIEQFEQTSGFMEKVAIEATSFFDKNKGATNKVIGIIKTYL